MNADRQRARTCFQEPRPLEDGCSGERLDRDHLTPLVMTAGRTNPVRNIRGTALRARAQLRQMKNAVVRAPHPLTAPRRFALGYSHKKSIELEFVENAPRRRNSSSFIRLRAFSTRFLR